MHLKNLEIVGFKSFCDRVKLDFEPGITAIVGPNGCGKSNIIDAIRWCLGEMSAKSLRSNLMLDVVFNGSGSRPPGNMAEVTLTFDNSDKRLPIDFSDVSITRRLFRSGESEYYINKTQCRLKDIRELFLDTGMGEDGYSSIEQGKIEWVLQAKPEQRRELFEEAAGVSKYRARREEAVRKLEKVDVDLSRIADIISVTGDQIRKLENAVTRAKTYQRIKEELKVMEIGDWLIQLSQQETTLTTTQEGLAKIQKIFEEQTTQSHQLDADLTQIRVEFVQTEEELLKANSFFSSIDSEIKITEARIQSAIQRVSDLSNQVQNILQNIDREKIRIEELKTQENLQKETLQNVEASGESIETDFKTATESYNSSLVQLEEKKTEVKNIRDQILDRAQVRARLQQTIGNLSSDANRFESQITSTEREKQRTSAEWEELKVSVEKTLQLKEALTQQFTSKSTTLEEVALKLTELNNQEENLRKEVLQKSEDIARTKGQIHSIETQQVNDPYLNGAQTLMASNLPGIYGPLSRLFHTAENQRDVVVSSIGEHLGDMVADTSEDAAKAIEYLAQTQKGRSRIWILNKIPQALRQNNLGELPQNRNLLQFIQCDDKFKPLLTHLTSSMIVEGSTIFGDLFVNGGVDPNKWKSHTLLRLPELEEKLASLEKQKITSEENLLVLTLEQARVTDLKETSVRELEECRIRLQLTEEELKKGFQKQSIIEREQATIEKEIQSLTESMTKTKENLQQNLISFEEFQNAEKNDHELLDQAQHQLSLLQASFANANADLQAKSEKHKTFLEKVQWQKSILEHTRKEIESLNSNISRQQDIHSHLIAQIEQTQKSQEESKLIIEGAIVKRQEAQDQCSAIQVRRSGMSENIQALDKQLHSLRSLISENQNEIQTLLIQETTLKNKNETLLQKLKEQYELSLEEAKQQFQPQAADVETLEKLKKRIANIGPINLAAPQEHAELSEKQNFLTTQQADLLKAKDDLKQVITKINSTTKEHFKETFDKVRNNFRTLYSQLFQGGEADIRLTDESDILNCGIDIFCQPPGKKLLHISLLSGGEKALTACALLFSFFQVRPSPVALLDEVDAPLDEANILRYADLIKMFSQNSQFFMISHNKRTMEAANSLYGVTMEELGVSKILSARLQKDRKKIEATLDKEQPASV